MKQAGLKNSGAWYRFNKWLKKYRASVSGPLGTIIAALDTFQPYVDALQAIAQATGLDAAQTTDLGTGLATGWMSEGIPLEVWMGRLDFDTYTSSVNGAGKTVYKPDHAAAAWKFANDLRKAVYDYKRASRMANDIINLTTADNPGGIADATPGD